MVQSDVEANNYLYEIIPIFKTTTPINQQTTFFSDHPSFSFVMTEFNFGGTEEENVELKKLNGEIVSVSLRGGNDEL